MPNFASENSARGLAAEIPNRRRGHGHFAGGRLSLGNRKALPDFHIKRDTTEHAGDSLDCGAPGEYVLAHGGHSTRPGKGRRERRCRPRRCFQPPKAPTFVGAHSQNGGVAGAPSPTPPLARLRGSHLRVVADARLEARDLQTT